jgi:hypothetical protein
MNSYVVLYRDDSLLPADAPLAFVCDADDADHAEEQCENAYPDSQVVWVVEGTQVQVAYDDYYNI